MLDIYIDIRDVHDVYREQFFIQSNRVFESISSFIKLNTSLHKGILLDNVQKGRYTRAKTERLLSNYAIRIPISKLNIRFYFSR